VNRRRPIPKHEVSAKEGAGQLVAFLYRCTPSMLAGATPADLVNRHRGVTLKQAEYELTIARQRRAGEL